MKSVFKTTERNIDNTGRELVTAKLRQLIDETAQAEGILLLEKGRYLTSSLFLKSNMEFCLEEGAVLLGTTDESQYPVLSARVAGIEMDWYPGVLNCNGQKNVVICGAGKSMPVESKSVPAEWRAQVRTVSILILVNTFWSRVV